MSVNTAVMTLCAVIPVHAAVTPDHLTASLASLVAQERRADEVIIVQDGPLPAELLEVIDDFAERRPECRRLGLDTSRGPGGARQAALEVAHSDVIALQDSDDISLPERFGRQFALIACGEADMVGSAMLEFRARPDNIVGLRQMPENPSEIAKYARLRMPVNNPTAMFRRDLALAVGGYRNLPVNEDYDLVARILVAGGRLRNLPEPLVLFRADDAMFRRRRMRSAKHAELALQHNLVEYGLISRTAAMRNLLLRVCFRLLPPRVMRRAYRSIYLQRIQPAGAATSLELPCVRFNGGEVPL